MSSSSYPSQARRNFQTSRGLVQSDPAQLYIEPVKMPRNIIDLLSKPIKMLGFNLEECPYDCAAVKRIHRIRGKNRYVGLVYVNDKRVADPRFMTFLHIICGWLDNKGFYAEPGLWLISTLEVSRKWDKEVQALREKGKIREIRFITEEDIPTRKTGDKMWDETMRRWVERNLAGMEIEPIPVDGTIEKTPTLYIIPETSVGQRPQVEGALEATSPVNEPAVKPNAGAKAARASATPTPANYEGSKIPSPLDDLRQLVTQKRVLAIVGAGISIAATEDKEPKASWKGLLEYGVEYSFAKGLMNEEEADHVRGLIEHPPLILSAADAVSRCLKSPDGGMWKNWLEAAFKQLKASNPTVIHALYALQIPLATTNYDGLIESNTDLKPVTWEDDGIENVIKGEHRDVLVHIHGYWKIARTVVLGVKSYEELLRNEFAKAALQGWFTNKTVLFVGCGEGMHDPNFTTLLEWLRKTFPKARWPHYRLVSDDQKDEIKQEHDQKQDPIRVLSYGSHHNLAEFLRKLGASN